MSYEYFKKRLKFIEKEIKKNEKYKHSKEYFRISYIYFLQNKTNKKIYIGRSVYGVEERFNQHVKNAFNKNCERYNSFLSIDIRKYGKDDFILGYLDCEYCYRRDFFEANKLEMEYIKKYNTTYPKGYNIVGLKCYKLKKGV